MAAIVEGRSQAPLVMSSPPVPDVGTVEEATKKAADASKAAKEADEAARAANESTFLPAFQESRKAALKASQAASEARAAGLAVQQAKANAVLERKLNRPLKKGEYARWVSGDHNNMRLENIELCSSEILEMEAKTGHHVSEEEIWDMENPPKKA